MNGTENEVAPLSDEEKRAAQDTLATIVEGLPPPLREAWVLRWICGIKSADAARRLHIGTDEFLSRLYSAMNLCVTRMEAAGVDMRRAALLYPSSITRNPIH